MKKRINCVLLIDDDEATNFLTQMIIENADCAEGIQVANSGQQAIHYLTNSGTYTGEKNKYPRPDLIFLDINMPAMTGWEFLEKYKELEKAQRGNTVIIMLTTSLNPDEKLRSQSIPYIAGFENKPLSDEKLEKILVKYFPDYF